MSRVETLAEGVTLYLGDCREILPTLPKSDSIITDPPYESVMQENFGSTSLVRLEIRKLKSVHAIGELKFDAIDEIRDDAARAICAHSNGWAIIFCIAEGVRAWRDLLQAAGAKYKRAMVWMKTDPMPQFNGQGPSIGHEMMVAVWCGSGHSKWNGGGKSGNFLFGKNNNGDHPTQKPLPLMGELVRLFSNHGGSVCDPFMGSGTTGVAAIKLGRKFIGIEREPKYFDIACRRVSETLKQPDMFIEQPKPAKQLEWSEMWSKEFDRPELL